MADADINITIGGTVDIALSGSATGGGISFKVEQFEAGVDLSAGQRSGATEIPTEDVFLEDSLQVWRNNIPQTRGTHYNESPDLDGITMLEALETDDELEFRYAKN